MIYGQSRFGLMNDLFVNNDRLGRVFCHFRGIPIVLCIFSK